MNIDPAALLSAAIVADPELAWAWHCNIAVPIMDSIPCTHEEANEAAAHLMQHLFGCDITTHPHYEYGKTGAHLYRDFRMEMDRREDDELAKSGGAE